MMSDWLYIFGLPAVIAYLSSRWMEARNAREVRRLMVELRDARKGGQEQLWELVEARRMLALALQLMGQINSASQDHQAAIQKYLDHCHAWEKS